MRSNPTPRLQRVLVLMVLAGALAPLLGGFGTSAPLPPAWAQGVSAEELFEEGQKLFEDKRYKDAFERFDAVRSMAPEFLARQVEYLRLASAFRLAALQGESELMRELSLTIQLFQQREFDEWSARLVSELVRWQGPYGGQVHQSFQQALVYWESLPDVEKATLAYLDLMEATLKHSNTYYGVDTNLARMWRNLVAIEAPTERLVPIAAHLLSGQQYQTGRPIPVPYQGGDFSSKGQVAEDVLELDAPRWLAAMAHLVLAQLAEGQASYRVALDHARTVLELVDADDTQAHELAEQIVARITTPRMSIVGSQLYRPGSHHPLNLNWRNLSGWSLTLRRLDAVKDLRQPFEKAFTANLDNPAYWYRGDGGRQIDRRTRIDHAERDARRDVSPKDEPHMPRGESIVLEPLEPGLYLALLEGEVFDGKAPEAQRLLFQVTDVGLIVQNIDGAEVEFWLVDMNTGQALNDVDLGVHQAWRVQGRGKAILYSGSGVRTDDDGIARERLAFDRGSGTLFAVAQVGERPLLSVDGSRWRGGNPNDEQWRAFILTDRPLYRPGETVHLQAFLRAAVEAERVLRNPAGEQVELLIRAPDGSEFLKQSFALDDNGALETELELPDRPALGPYAIALRHVGTNHWAAHGKFQVDEYRLPEFTVSAQLDQDKRYVLGDSLNVEVSAEYLFGGPVRGEAEVVVRRSPYWHWYQPWIRYGWLHEQPHAMRVPYYHGSGGEVLRVTLPLDEEGKLSLSIPTEDADPNTGSWSFSIEARVVDSSRREESGGATVRVGRQELYAFVNAKRHLVSPGDEARLKLKVQDLMSRGVAHAGQWSVSLQLENGKMKKVFERLVQTDDAGDAELSFSPNEPGHYTVRYWSQDGRGNEFEASSVVWCADPRTQTVVWGDGAVKLIVEQDEIVGSDVVKVLLVTDTPGVPVHLTEAFAFSVETRVIEMKGTAKLLEIPIDDFHRPYFYLRAVRPRDYRLHTSQVRVVAPKAEAAVQLALTLDKGSYEPGAEARLSIAATDALGRPVPGPVTLAVVDEAILALMPRQLADPTATFHSFQSQPPRTLSLSSQRFGGFVEFDPEEEAKEGDDLKVGLGGARRRDRDQFAGGVFEGEAMAERAMVSDAAMPAAKMSQANVRGGRAEEMALQVPTSSPISAADPLAGTAPVTVRTDFRTTALWRTAVWTDEDGRASVEIPLAESLTKWNVLAVAITPDSKTGMAETTTRTRKRVMVRLNHPRVFREGDRFLFAATVHNESDEDLDIAVRLKAAPLSVEGGDQVIEVSAHAQQRVQWWAKVVEGSANAELVRDEKTGRILVIPRDCEVEVTAVSSLESDAFVRKVELIPWGSELTVVAAGELKPGSTTLTVDLPSDRAVGLTQAVFTVSPTVISTCIDALSYLAGYPYGCTEQTLSRFVPAVAVRHVVEVAGLSSKRIDPELDDKVRKGIARIRDFQHGDGGWGWWKEDESSPYMTSYVLVALSRAIESGVRVDRSMLDRGRNALAGMLPKLERNPDDMAYALYAIACVDEAAGRKQTSESDAMKRFASQLFDGRDDLRDYSRALLASYEGMAGRTDNGILMLRKLDDTVQLDTKYDTARWGRLHRWWWRGEGAVETTAFVIEAYGRLQPDHDLRKQAVRWMVMNRRGHRWDNTRATAHAIYSLVDYSKGAGELSGDYTLVASLGGREVARVVIDPDNVLDGGGSYPVPAELLRDGTNQLDLQLQGSGVAYVTLAVDCFSAEDDPAPTEHWLEVKRELIRLRPQRTLGGNILAIEEPMKAGDSIASGDRLKVRLTLVAHTDLEYLAIEDPRPAGCEPVERLSGWFWQGSLGGRREVRDELNAFFISRLTEGEHVLEYELRAESPGTYRVAPAIAYGMYLPEVSGSSRAFRLGIEATDAVQ